jgi:hypothetical protein
MKIISSQTEVNPPYDVLVVVTDQGTMRITQEQKGPWKDYGLLYVGLEGKLKPITIPEDPKTKQPKIVLRGYTGDVEVINLFNKFMEKYA